MHNWNIMDFCTVVIIALLPQGSILIPVSEYGHSPPTVAPWVLNWLFPMQTSYYSADTLAGEEVVILPLNGTNGELHVAVVLKQATVQI